MTSCFHTNTSGSVTARIAELASALAPSWLTIDDLEVELRDRSGSVDRSTIRRAVQRLVRDGVIEKRLGPHPVHGWIQLLEVRHP